MNGRLGIGVRVPACRPATEIASVAARAERIGFDSVWIPDSQLLWRDVWTALALAADRTGEIRLGTAVTNLETRHPTVTASAARTVQEIAGDRLRIGVGTGNSSLGLLGMAPTRRADLGAGIDLMRRLLSGAGAGTGGGTARLRDPAGPCPIYLAASGPKNLGFAGETGDGAILLSGVSKRLLERSTALVRAGAVRAGRDPDDVAIVVSAFAHLTDDPERDARMLKPLCLAIALGGGSAALAAEGIRLPEPLPSAAGSVYPDLVHAEDWDAAVSWCDAYVSDADALRFAEAFCLFGDESRLREGIDLVRSLGASELLLQHVGSYDLPDALLDGCGALFDGRSGGPGPPG